MYAVINAVVDAVGSDVAMPATAQAVWNVLKKKQKNQEAA